MITKIDWLSFTVKLTESFEVFDNDASRYMFKMAKAQFPDDLQDVLFDQPFTQVKGRAPYTVCLRREDNHVSVFFGGKQAHILFEITGAGCEDIARHSKLLSLVELVKPALSRLDVAVDMHVPTTPVEFVATGYSDRFKSISQMVSETGSTFYVGSRDSERYARVYRYNPPHPRSDWLRCEFVVKHENATNAAALILDVGLPEVTARLGYSFGWKNPCWQPDKVVETGLPGWTPERRHGATVRWLLTSVFPAMAKLVKDGTISDLPAFLDTHLYQLIDD